MRFLHTADWQIGMKAAHVGEAGARVREERLEAARRVVLAAQDFGAEFIIVAGDTFEDNGVERVNVQKVADILAQHKGPVYLIPGNHDPLVPGSVWEHPAWGSHPNLFVLEREEPLEIQGGFLYPCPVVEKYSGKDPTDWIDATSAEGIMVGVAHGTVEGVDPEERDHPIPADAPSRSGLDYLALGHWHSYAAYESGGAVRMAYSGTHETTRFGERDSGQILLVEIASPGEAPVIVRKKTGMLEWSLLNEEVRERGDLERVKEQIESLEDPANRLIYLMLFGLLHFSESEEVARLEEIIASRFLFGRIDISMLHPMPEDEDLLTALPVGIMREAAIRLLELADPEYSGERPEAASEEVASRAILELYAMAQEIAR